MTCSHAMLSSARRAKLRSPIASASERRSSYSSSNARASDTAIGFDDQTLRAVGHELRRTTGVR